MIGKLLLISALIGEKWVTFVFLFVFLPDSSTGTSKFELNERPVTPGRFRVARILLSSLETFLSSVPCGAGVKLSCWN